MTDRLTVKTPQFSKGIARVRRLTKLKNLFSKSDSAASVAASAGGADKRARLVIWPEWNDADVNAEKWDVAHKGKGKEDKGKSPVVQHFFEDPEGKVELPHTLRVDHWKRPQDFITEGTPVVVDSETATCFDLITNNEHIHNSELMRCVISQIQALWEMHTAKPPTPEEHGTPIDESGSTWKPWEHIYALCKVGKGPHQPLYNPHGKYIVRLYWMGCWRKITIDDSMPFDDEGRLLLPVSMVQTELWPMLLAKALLKVASLDYNGGSNSSEFGDCSVIHCLTGWIPETIPLHQSHMTDVWELLKGTIPEWILPEQDWEKPLDPSPEHRKEGSIVSEMGNKDEKGDKDSVTTEKKGDKPDAKKDVKEKGSKDAKEKEKSKDGDKKKDKDKDKDKNKEKSVCEEVSVPEKPEIVVFASYWSTPKHPAKVSVLGEVADAGEKLRQNGLSHLYPHPVWIRQTRSCPLEAPQPPEKIPAWKLIRPRVKKTTPSDEPKAAPEPPKPIQCIELTSPFVNYKVSPVPIPTDCHRPKSSLERGGTRSRPSTSAGVSIEETDENLPELSASEELLLTGDQLLVNQESNLSLSKSKSDTGSESASKPSTPNKPGTPQGKRKPSSATKQSATEVERKASKVGSQIISRERSKSSAGKSDSKTFRSEDRDQLKGVTSSEAGLAGDITSGDIVEEASIDVEKPEIDCNEVKPKKFWMDYDIFYKCFKSLYIYHKPSTYLCNNKHSDLKSIAPIPVATGKEKKTATPAAQGVNASSSKTSQTPTHALHNAPSPSNPQSGVDDKTHHYLFVDNLKPTDIVVLYSSVSRWHDPPPVPVLADEKKSHSSLKGKEKESEKEMTAGTSSSLLEGSTGKDVAPQPVTPGTLVAEPYSWKSLVTGQPILRLRTTGTRSAVLSLPAGRHVLRFMMSAPLGYHIHLCSTVNFVFGEEDAVMCHLKNESCRFIENANLVINCLGKCIQGYSESEIFKSSFDELVSSHCPYRKVKLASKQHHFQVFNESLYAMLRKALTEVISPDMVIAWRAFNYDVTTKSILGYLPSSRPATGNTSHRGSAKTSSKKHAIAAPVEEPEKVENPWIAKYMEPSVDEHIAAVKLQKVWRGYWVRKIKSARQPGTEEHAKAMENLQKAWAVIESNAEAHGLFLFRHMFKADPELMPYYSFYKDEWNKISFEDYQGNYPDQPPNTWFVIFREIFYVQEEMLAVPKVYVPINTCMLRVINNDTGEEIPRVFHKVAPYVYKRNKRGYTFVADARSTDLALMANKWRMRLIGSLSPLPAPIRPEVNCSFQMKEIKDYYLPNNKNIIFRYSVRVTDDHLASLQVNTSKSDVYIKLIVLDNEEEVRSTVGKGHVVLPAFIFHKDIHPEDKQSLAPEEEKKEKHEDHKRSGSRASTKGGKGQSSSSKESVSGKAKRSSSAKSQEGGRTSRSSPVSEFIPNIEYDEKDLKPHKYIIQAEVMKNSWPLSESSWTFVNMLKEMEKNELKVAFKERQPSPVRNEKAAKETKAKPAKGGKDKGNKDKEGKNSRPPSQQFDTTKPFWVLRFVSDANAVDDVEVRKDTERADEIRAMKKAWEDAEPGRAAKALQSRLKYLNSHMVKVLPDGAGEGEERSDEDDKSTTEGTVESQDAPPSMPPATPVSMLDQDDTVLTLEPPAPPTPKEILLPLDITPFLRRTSGETRYLDEAELQRQVEKKQQEIQQYRVFRERVEKWREQDKQNRNHTKQKQLEECEELQATLDAARLAVNVPREAIRQRHLEEERRKQEEMAAQEANNRAELEAKSPKGKKGSAKGKKSAGKKGKK